MRGGAIRSKEGRSPAGTGRDERRQKLPCARIRIGCAPGGEGETLLLRERGRSIMASRAMEGFREPPFSITSSPLQVDRNRIRSCIRPGKGA